MAAQIIWVAPPRPGSDVLLALVGAAPGAGVIWRVAQGAGTIAPLADHADDAGQAGARYMCADSVGALVRVEVDFYA